jgi:hypothetical protein
MATPNGMCWDDCGGHPKPGSFFLPGHDKRAERYLAALDNAKPLTDRLAVAGYVPGNKSLRADTLLSDAGYEECGRLSLDGQPCRIIGRGAGMRRHRAHDSQHLPEDG